MFVVVVVVFCLFVVCLLFLIIPSPLLLLRKTPPKPPSNKSFNSLCHNRTFAGSGFPGQGNLSSLLRSAAEARQPDLTSLDKGISAHYHTLQQKLGFLSKGNHSSLWRSAAETRSPDLDSLDRGISAHYSVLQQQFIPQLKPGRLIVSGCPA